ncbi:hypothetical protein SK128_010010 [Halocaridina rubra]|uniref:Uncharacterized protein n=1 Tax=Halocaridina rubra TaxID=373956 RepID=A0AAN8XSB4_HALRR
MAGILFEDIFDVKDIDPDGKKFDRGTVCVNMKAYRMPDEKFQSLVQIYKFHRGLGAPQAPSGIPGKEEQFSEANNA